MEPIVTRPPAFRAAIEAYICAQANPVDKLSHQPRLYRVATQIAAGDSYDDDVLHAAIWLHDLGVFIGHRPEEPAALAAWDNVAYACQRAPEILARLGFPPSKIPQVQEAIRTHLPTSTPTAFEGWLIHDADILEQLGAIAILRTVSKVGRDTRFPLFINALTVLRRNTEQLPACLHLPAARQLAASRLATLASFLAAAEAEASGVEG